MRKSGILLPIASLPSEYGIGCMSSAAYEFVDFLKAAGQSFWQILPIGPTGYGDSPYQSFSTFAGNPYFISPEDLIKRGWLKKSECAKYDFGDDPEYIDYEKVYKSRFRMLRKAFERSDIKKDEQFIEFTRKNKFWLDDYALYMALKNAHKGESWACWEDGLRLRHKAAMADAMAKYDDEITFYKFQQYLFEVEWQDLKGYANRNGVEIVGDIPIYVAADSADTWSHPEMFQLNDDCVPIAVAGCPPDAFSSTGQLWGNPLYDWEYLKKTDYAWWMQRIDYCYSLYDVLRIDHFRGFDEYYSIPYGDSTAEFGHWEKGPGYDLFRTMKEKLGPRRVIAEDLGFLTPSVIKLVKKTGYPGMKILQFAFDSREESDYLPHNYGRNSIVYTGTHDNNTTCGWYYDMNRADRSFAREYLGIKNGNMIVPALIRTALSCVADTAIIPVQDYLGLGKEARINFPSTLGDNWKWRMLNGQCTPELAKDIHEMTRIYGRLGKQK
ncbi:MAG: 4-alpha-glucanotransferase [Lachnospiraceae bacterium]|nr:4-alpha-glucanotransferase [Lachnospiraceae bacterium]